MKRNLYLFLFLVLWMIGTVPGLDAQDDCVDATEIQVNTYEGCAADFFDITLNAGLTASPEEPLPDCGNYGTGQDDHWLRFTVPPNTTRLNFGFSRLNDPLMTMGANMAIYRGDDCANLEMLACMETHYASPLPPLLPEQPLSDGRSREIVENLIPGETIWLRVWERESRTVDVRIGISQFIDPPANDECNAPSPLTSVGCNYGASGNDITAPGECGWNSTDNTTFYSFEVTDTTPRPISITIDNVKCVGGCGTIQLAIYKWNGINCNGIGGTDPDTYHGCASGTGSVTITATPANLPNGQYVLAVDGCSGARGGSFTNPIPDVADCAFGFSGTVVQEQDPPQAMFSAPEIICAGQCIDFQDQSTDFPSSWSWTFEGATVATSNSRNPRNICFPTPGDYRVTLRVTNSGGSTAFSRTITVRPTFDVDAGSDASVCAGQGVTLDPTISGGTAPYSFRWTPAADLSDPSIQNPVATPAVATSYTLEVTDSDGCSNSDVVNVTPSAEINARVLEDPICANPLANFTLSATSVPGASYRWNGPNGFFAFTAEARRTGSTGTDSGVYTVSVTVPGCPPVDRTVEVQIQDVPELSASGNTPVCVGGSLQLTGTPDPDIAGVQYDWSGPAGFNASGLNASRPNITLAGQGEYSLQGTINGCVTDVAVVSVEVADVPTNLTIRSNAPLCRGESLQLTGPLAPGASYDWAGPDGFGSSVRNPVRDDIQLNQAGIYSLNLDVGPCTTQLTTVVDVEAPNPPTVNPDRLERCGPGRLTFTVTPLPGHTYRLYENGQQVDQVLGAPFVLSFEVGNTEETWNITAVDPRGCEGDPTPVTAVPLPQPSAPPAQEVSRCGPGVITFSPQNSTPPAATLRLFSQAAGGNPVAAATAPDFELTTPTINATTTYFLEAEDASGCISPRSQVVTAIEFPDAPEVEDARRCGDGVLTFSADVPANTTMLMLYDAETGGNLIDFTDASPWNIETPVLNQTTTYWLAIRDGSGCVSERTPTVAFVDFVFNIPPTSEVPCDSGAVTFSFSNLPPGGVRLYASATAPNPLDEDLTSPFELTTPEVSSPTTYYISHLTPGGCEGARTLAVVNYRPENKPSPPLVEPISRCGRGFVTLNADFSEIPGDYIEVYRPTQPLGQPELQLTPPDFETEWFVDASTVLDLRAVNLVTGCRSEPAELDVTIIETPGVPRTDPVRRCGGGEFVLEVQPGDPAGDTYHLYDRFTAQDPIESNNTPEFGPLGLIRRTTTYFVSAANGVCESPKVPLEVVIGPLMRLNVDITPDFDGQSGEVHVEAFGGIPPYRYRLGDAEQTSPEFTGLAAGDYLLWVYDAGNCVATQKVTVPYIPRECAAPAVPQVVENHTDNRLGFSWPPVDDATHYELEYRVLGTDTWSDPVVLTDTVYFFRELRPEETYEVRLRTFCVSLYSDYTLTQLRTPICNSVNFVFTNNVTEFSAQVQWTEMLGADAYEFTWRKSPEVWQPLEVLQVPQRNLSGLAPGTTYDVRVQTLCRGGSVIADFVYGGFTTLKCDPVTQLDVATQPGAAIVTWAPVPDVDRYLLRYRTENSPWTVMNATSPERLTGLQAGQTYEVQLRSRCRTALSAWSDSERFRFTETSRVEGAVSSQIVGLYPNPNRGRFQLHIEAEGRTTADIRIFNLTGREVLHTTTTLTAGGQVIDLDAGEVPAGVYFLHFRTESGSVLRHRFVVQD